MATAAKTTPQDLPPKGGYAAFVTERTKLRSLLSGRTAILGYFALTAGSFYVYFHTLKAERKHDIEMRSARLAMTPLLVAERDREYLKQLKRNRADEAEVMKNVPNWEVGTLFGAPVYKTIPKDRFVDPLVEEYYVHTSDKIFLDHTETALWC